MQDCSGKSKIGPLRVEISGNWWRNSTGPHVPVGRSHKLFLSLRSFCHSILVLAERPWVKWTKRSRQGPHWIDNHCEGLISLMEGSLDLPQLEPDNQSPNFITQDIVVIYWEVIAENLVHKRYKIVHCTDLSHVN